MRENNTKVGNRWTLLAVAIGAIMVAGPAFAEVIGVNDPNYTFTRFLIEFFQTLLVVAIIAAAMYGTNRWLSKIYAERGHLVFIKHSIMIGLALFFTLAMIIFMPFSDENRSSLLAVFGISLSALIALSSTTVTGNAIAGMLLRPMWRIQNNDFARIGDHFGRVTSIHLLRVELQTDQGTLVSFPAMYVISNPIEVLRRESTVISATVSLGYDVPRKQVEHLLLEAAEQTGLQKHFVLVQELGDFAVTYSVQGVLENFDHYLQKRSLLLSNVLDVLHDAEVEIASPNLMNTRMSDKTDVLIPQPMSDAAETPHHKAYAPDHVVFDKSFAGTDDPEDHVTGGRV